MTSRRRRFAVATTAAVILALAGVTPAAAEPTAKSTATLTVTGGTLDITVNHTHSNLNRHRSTAQDNTISGILGQVTVTDRRNAPAGSGWVANVTATPFTPKTGPAIPARKISYTAGHITKHGTATYTANNSDTLKHPTAAVTATNISGNNTATWTPTLTVNIPNGISPGTYTATITHSVL